MSITVACSHSTTLIVIAVRYLLARIGLIWAKIYHRSVFLATATVKRSVNNEQNRSRISQHIRMQMALRGLALL